MLYEIMQCAVCNNELDVRVIKDSGNKHNGCSIMTACCNTANFNKTVIDTMLRIL